MGRTNAGDFADLGVRASADHVEGGGVQCSQNDTVLVLMPNQDSYVEAGWATEQTTEHDNLPVCAASGMTNSPQAFYFYRQDGHNTCVYFNQGSNIIHVSGGDNPSAAVYSSTANPGTWIMDFNNGSGGGFTHSVPGWTYTTGAGLTNCDRNYLNPSDHTKEKCDAHFTGMQYRIANPSPHWADWGSEVCANHVDGTPPLPNLDSDGTWHNQLTQPNEVTVAAGPESC